MRRTLGIAAFAAAAGCASGQLMMTMETESFGPTAPDFSIPLTFDQFSGNPADLVSIEVIVELSVDGGLGQLDNDSDTPSTVDVSFGTSVDLSSTDVSLLDGGFMSIGDGVSVLTMGSLFVDVNDGDSITQFDNDGGADNNSIAGNTDSTSDSGFVNPAVWGSGTTGFLGGGTFDIVIDGDTEFSVTGGTGVSQASTPQNASGSITVIYKFTPAPSAAALLGLAGLAATRRRR